MFSDVVGYYGPKLKMEKMDFMITNKNIYMVGRVKVKKGPEKGKIQDCLFRKIPNHTIQNIVLSPFQDDFILINVNAEPSIFMSSVFKTELVYVLSVQCQNSGTIPVLFEEKYLKNSFNLFKS